MLITRIKSLRERTAHAKLMYTPMRLENTRSGPWRTRRDVQQAGNDGLHVWRARAVRPPQTPRPQRICQRPPLAVLPCKYTMSDALQPLRHMHAATQEHAFSKKRRPERSKALSISAACGSPWGPSNSIYEPPGSGCKKRTSISIQVSISRASLSLRATEQVLTAPAATTLIKAGFDMLSTVHLLSAQQEGAS